jgi:hypothetical protein
MTSGSRVDPELLLSRLSYSHFAELMTIEQQEERAFYEIECVRGAWSVRELKRQVGALGGLNGRYLIRVVGRYHAPMENPIRKLTAALVAVIVNVVPRTRKHGDDDPVHRGAVHRQAREPQGATVALRAAQPPQAVGRGGNRARSGRSTS